MIRYKRVQRTRCYKWPNWIELRIRLNEFEMFKWFYNDELKLRMTKITIYTYCCNKNMKFLAVVTPPASIYHGCSTQKTFWEVKDSYIKYKSARAHQRIYLSVRRKSLWQSTNINMKTCGIILWLIKNWKYTMPIQNRALLILRTLKTLPLILPV